MARPPVVRRKIEPGAGVEQEPISVADMPTDYMLSFTPPLSVTVVPSVANDSLFRSAVLLGKVGWHKTRDWAAQLLTGQPSESGSSLRMTLTADHAQSLAWSLVDGMAIVIRRPAEK